jgi:hypothetical protein
MSIYMKGNPDDLSKISSGYVEEGTDEKITEKTAVIAAEEEENLQEMQTDERANPLAAAIKKADKQIKVPASALKKTKEGKGEKRLKPPQEIESGIREFSNKNPKFTPDKLRNLLDKLKDGMSKEEILKLVREEYPNPMDASQALEFLASISLEDYKEGIQSVQMALNKEIIDKREEEVAKKVETEAALATTAASAAAVQIAGGGDLNQLLEHFILNSKMEATAIAKIIQDAFGDNQDKIYAFLLKKCGAEIKKCGVEINKLRELKDHHDEDAFMKNAMPLLRKLQAIKWVSSYFKIRNKPKPEIAGQKPAVQFNPQEMAKQFLSLVSERFLSPEKVIQTAAKLGAVTLEDQIVLISQERDAVRQVSMNHIFRSPQHRDEMFSTILEALSDLEDLLEDQMIEEEEAMELQVKPSP